ncbi:MAG TPA: hypothetical protein VFL13_02480 [Candidatus Baltobacteraceae bacterium]|nr:hypothetical protein [Candidatus Baltobacteraceae bacterium]
MLDIPAAMRADYSLAAAYLSRDRTAAGVLHAIRTTHRAIHLRTALHGNDRFDSMTNTVYWDPYSALRTTQGGRQSPALGLVHELAHAALQPRREASLDSQSVAKYDTMEERRVIRGVERASARTLGESMRTDHRGSVYRVATPVSR